MTKKEQKEQERIDLIKNIINRKTQFTKEQEERIKRYIFNILISNTVLNKYEYNHFGNVFTGETVHLYDCIEYMSNIIANEKGDNNDCKRNV